jgi:hypothetical protein
MLTGGLQYLFQGLQGLWVDFPDIIGLCGCIEVFSTLHDVDEAVVCEVRDGVGQVGESSRRKTSQGQ